MTDKAKVLVTMLMGLMLISLSVAGGIFYLFQKEQAEKLNLREQLEETKLNLEKSRLELTSAQKEISALEFQAADSKTQIEALTSELQQEKLLKQEATRQVELLKKNLEEQQNSKLDLEKKFNQAQGDVKKIETQVNQLKSQKAELETKINELETKSKELEARRRGVELGTIVVAPEGAGSESLATGGEEELVFTATPEGTLLVINKEHNFAVINLGSEDGVYLGSIFSVYHNNKYVGDIKVEKVHDSMSAAGFLSPDIENRIYEGDRVIQKSK